MYRIKELFTYLLVYCLLLYWKSNDRIYFGTESHGYFSPFYPLERIHPITGTPKNSRYNQFNITVFSNTVYIKFLQDLFFTTWFICLLLCKYHLIFTYRMISSFVFVPSLPTTGLFHGIEKLALFCNIKA